VAEKYLDGKPVIAPALQRLLFRYASLLFAIHLVFVVCAVVFKRSFTVFPFLYVPNLGVVDAIMYLPMAFLADFGAIALLLYFITRSGREITLPWPKFASDLDELQAPATKPLAARIANLVAAVFMVALTSWAFSLYARFQTLFALSTNGGRFKPLFMPGPGRLISLAVLVMLAAGTATLFIKSFTVSRRLACWVDTIANAVALVMIGMLLRQPQTGLFAVNIPARFATWVHASLTVTLLVVALFVAIDLVVNLVRLGRKRRAGR